MPKEIIKKVRSLMKNKSRVAEVETQAADAAPVKPAAETTPAVSAAVSPEVKSEAKPVKAKREAKVDAKSATKPATKSATKSAPRAASKTRAKSTEKADTASTEKVKEKAAEPAAAKSAAPRKKKATSEEMPAPLREVKRVRSREAASEEWRPSAARNPEPAGAGAGKRKEKDSEADAVRKPRTRRSRSDGSSRGDAAGKPAGDAAGKKSDEGSAGGDGESKPRTRQSRSGGNRRRSDGDRRGGDRGGEERPRKNVPSRGKGFSFPRPKTEHGNWQVSDYVVAEAEGKTRFVDLGLPDELLHAVSDLGYEYCTPIQAEILPALLSGQDGLGQAQTGTGKTAAFLLAAFTRMLREPVASPRKGTPRVLIVAPTRELVLQIEEEAAEIGKYTPFQTLPVYGGLDFEAQKDALMDNVVDLVAATPGRLIDFLRKKVVDLSQVEILVLDEADRMLDMGFIPDVKRIVYATQHKDKRQTLFFSATFTDDVRRLAQSWTRDAVSVVIEPEQVAADTVDQKVFIVTDEQKFPLTVNLLRNFKPSRCLIFTNRRDSAQYLCDRLMDYEFSCALLTGAVPQAKRVRTLERFKSGEIPIVVATDVAGRGIHVEEVELVINFNLPEDAEDYVHRIGRTGRAGAEGRSVGFADEMDAMLVPDIEKYLGRELKCTHPEEAWLEVEPRERTHHMKRRREEGDRRGQGGGGGRSGGGRSGGARGGGGRSGGGRSSGGRSRR